MDDREELGDAKAYAVNITAVDATASRRAHRLGRRCAPKPTASRRSTTSRAPSPPTWRVPRAIAADPRTTTASSTSAASGSSEHRQRQRAHRRRHRRLLRRRRLGGSALQAADRRRVAKPHPRHAHRRRPVRVVRCRGRRAPHVGAAAWRRPTRSTWSATPRATCPRRAPTSRSGAARARAAARRATSTSCRRRTARCRPTLRWRSSRRLPDVQDLQQRRVDARHVRRRGHPRPLPQLRVVPPGAGHRPMARPPGSRPARATCREQRPGRRPQGQHEPRE